MKLQSNSVIDTSEKERAFASLPLLLHNLATYIESESTGNFFIVTDDNASCRFALRNGKITHCAFKRHKGHAALEAILTSNIKGIGRFSASRSPLRQNKEAIDHDYVVDILNIKTLKADEAENLCEEDKRYMIYRGQKTELTTDQEPLVKSTTKKSPSRMYRGHYID